MIPFDLLKLREEGPGLLPIFPVLIPEFLNKHLLLLPGPVKIKWEHGDNKGIPGNPVMKYHYLANGPDQVCRIHRMTDILIYPTSDQGVPFTQSDSDCPMPAQVPVGKK